MFPRLFAAGGLSFDRLRALLEVGASGGISKAAEGDPVKQSQYSRQIRELEDFFCVKLVERHGKGVRLTENGKELARIGRFFLLGLSNFQRGCLADDQVFRVAGSPTVIERFLMPVLSQRSARERKLRFTVESLPDDEIERRLHDLTIDFAIVTAETLSRPLKLQMLGEWRLYLWVPRGLKLSEQEALREFKARELPLVVAREAAEHRLATAEGYEPMIVCDDFLQAAAALSGQTAATLLPDFLRPATKPVVSLCCGDIGAPTLRYSLAWNPRLLRLNAHSVRVRDFLVNGFNSIWRKQ